MAVEGQASELVQVVVLLGAGIAAVALFRRLGLGSVLGYLCAGLLIGPFGLALFADPQAILHTAELGVVMFLFIIGLEMQPSRLWALRRQIFGLGVLQVVTATALLTVLGVLAGMPPAVALVAAAGFVLSSTAIVMQVLEERGDLHSGAGQRVVSILLLEDLAIVPLLALVAFLAPVPAVGGDSRLLSIGIALAALLGLLAVGRWLLNPMFRLLAAARAREVMTAAALLVVLGAALLMQLGGLSMAMGAFVAGVLLSESTFRHQLEADVEPFRGILLGLFFLSVGMSLDLDVVALEWGFILGGVLLAMLVKSIGIVTVARLTGAGWREAGERALLMAQGGEFAFVLFAAAAANGLFDARTSASLIAIVILSMALTPLLLLVARRLLPAQAVTGGDDIEHADGLSGCVLIIGFGRFGQVTSQSLLARGWDVTIIDTDVEAIRSAAHFGFKVYYGDGTRLDVLHACGADRARAIVVCVDQRDAADRVVDLAKSEFAHARLLVRTFDREHALKMVAKGVDFQIRETFESALAFGEAALRELGLDPDEAAATAAEVRRRDAERFELELTGGVEAGRDLLHGNAPRPRPLTVPTREARPLSEETEAVTQAARPGA